MAPKTDEFLDGANNILFNSANSEFSGTYAVFNFRRSFSSFDTHDIDISKNDTL